VREREEEIDKNTLFYFKQKNFAFSTFLICHFSWFGPTILELAKIYLKKK